MNVAVRTGWMETVTMGARVTVEGGDKLKVRAGLNFGGLLMMGFGFYASESKPAPGPAK